MSKFSRDKGLRTERHLVNLLQDNGLAAERVPLSGAAGGRYSGDISVPVLGEDWLCEVKCRATGFKQIEDWLGANHALIIKSDRKPALVVLPLRSAIDVLTRAEKFRAGAA